MSKRRSHDKRRRRAFGRRQKYTTAPTEGELEVLLPGFTSSSPSAEAAAQGDTAPAT